MIDDRYLFDGPGSFPGKTVLFGDLFTRYEHGLDGMCFPVGGCGDELHSINRSTIPVAFPYIYHLLTSGVYHWVGRHQALSGH